MPDALTVVHWCTAVSASLSASGRIAKLMSTPAGGDGVKHVTDVTTFDDKRPGDDHESPEKSACRCERPRIVVIRNAITVTDARALSLRLRKNSPARLNVPNASPAVSHNDLRRAAECGRCDGCAAKRPSPDATKIRCVCARRHAG